MFNYRPTLTAALLAGAISLAAVQPALADSAATTRNIILGAAVAIGIAVEANVAAKHAKATTVAGYLPNGAVVYQDGRVQNPDGSSYYPGNYGEQVACDGQTCNLSGGNGNDPYYGYNGGYNGGYPGGYTGYVPYPNGNYARSDRRLAWSRGH